ncbi:MAG TPA: TonB-dependent receptor [Bryobacteraceae bacterium]|nr:TonB-dependent receptor [Bryobacteraceae bacterium]
MKSGLRCLSLFLAFVLTSQLGLCQVTTATIYGTVLDATGGAVPGATVTVTNEGTAAVTNATSGTLGEFTVTFLAVGSYTVTVEAKGFKTYKQTGLPLGAGQRVQVEVKLDVGDTKETVSITADAPLLETSTAEQRQNLTTSEVRELPTARRDWTNLLAIGTGVRTAGSGGLTLNGLPPAAFRMTVDGTDAAGDPELPSLSLYQNFNYVKGVSLEAISEVNVSKGIASAEVSNTMSGNVNLITRSGTNQFHGSLFENNQTENYAARNQFLATKAPLVFNQFGGSLGGPAIKNKLFFFGVYEGYREKAFRPISGNVPTQELRDRAIAAVPAYKAFFDTFPLPNNPVAPGATTGFYQGAASNSASDNHAVARVDYNISSADVVSVRYTRGRPSLDQPRVTTNNRTFSGLTEVGTINYTHIQATISNQFRFGYNRNDVRRLDNLFTVGATPIVGNLGFGDAGETLFKGGSTRSFEDVVAVTKGRHSIKFGGLLINSVAGRDNIETPELRFASVDDLLANRVLQAQVTWGVNPFKITSWTMGFFAQDDFRVTRRLILNMGIRYDYMSVPRERDDRLFNRSAPFGFGPLRPADSVYDADRLNFAPRFGFAYTADDSGKTVIRGGTGVFTNPHTLFGGPVELVRNAVDEPNRFIFTRADIERLGLRYPITNANSLQYVRNPNAPWSNTSINTNFPNPYSIQFNFGVQRALTSSLVMESSYVGTRGVKLIMVRDYNQVDRITGTRNPSFGQNRYYDTSESSHYHSWQNSLRKRLSHNFLFNVHYTYSNNMSYNDGDLLLPNARPQDINNLRAEKGPTPFDIRHQFITDFLYEVPTPRWGGSAGNAMRLVLGGWQISGVMRVYSGSPFDLTQPSSVPGSRPDYISGEPINSNYRDTLQYLNRAAFALVPVIPASGATARPGTIGRNALRGPGSWNVDAGLAKNFAFTERTRFQFRVDLFNAFNHTNLGGVSTNIQAGNFGRLTSAGARGVQLNGRFSF